MSEFLNLLDLSGRTWCIVDIHGSAGFNIPPSDSVYFYALLSGSARLAGVGAEIVAFGPGESSIVLSGEAHAIRTAADSPTRTLAFLRDTVEVDEVPTFSIGESGPVTARMLCGKLTASLPGGLRRMSMPPYIKLDADTESTTPSVVRIRMLEAYATGGGAAALLSRMAALTLTIALRNHPQCPLLFQESATLDPIAHSRSLIAADPASDWSVEKLAQEVGMSRSTFAGRFRAEVGRTPMDVVVEQRMGLAADLLRGGHATVAEISGRVGYQSEAAFTRRFSAFFGRSPGQLRREAQRGRVLADPVPHA